MNTAQNRPRASIILIAYNEERIIEQAIQSACKQTAQAIEIVCVDDGSADATYERMRKCAACDSRIKIVHQPNGGTLAARCAGIRQATGVYSLFLDADDLLSPDAVQTACDAADEQGADVLEFGVQLTGDASNPAVVEAMRVLKAYQIAFTEKPPLPDPPYGPALVNACYAEGIISWCLWNKVYRTELLQSAVRFFEGERLTLGEDQLITLMILCSAKHYARIGTKLYTYTVGAGISSERIPFASVEAAKKGAGIWTPVKLAHEWLDKAGYPQDPIADGMTAYVKALRGYAVQYLNERCPAEYRPAFLEELSYRSTKEEFSEIICDAMELLDRRYRLISESTCWKMTKPIRRILDMVKGAVKES